MRIIITGSNFRNYLDSISSAFSGLSWKPEISATEFTKYKTKFNNKIINKLYRKTITRYIYKSHRENQQNILLQKLEKIPFEFLLIYKGNGFDSNFLNTIKIRNPNIKIILWLMDPFSKVGEINKSLSLYDYVFVYDKSDVSSLLSLNKNTYFLPVGYDPIKYKPIDDKEKKWQISFIGNIDSYRLSILENVISKLKLKKDDVKIISGSSKKIPFYSDYKLNKRSWLYEQNYIDHCSVNADQANIIYNQSLLCLNIHRIDTQQGYNPRLFEIPGSGGVQLVENLNGINNFFSEDEQEIISYNSIDDLINTADDLLRNQPKLFSYENNGHKRAVGSHTFAHRIKNLISIVN